MQLLVELSDSFLYWLYSLSDCELHIIHNLNSKVWKNWFNTTAGESNDNDAEKSGFLQVKKNQAPSLRQKNYQMKSVQLDKLCYQLIDLLFERG